MKNDSSEKLSSTDYRAKRQQLHPVCASTSAGNASLQFLPPARPYFLPALIFVLAAVLLFYARPNEETENYHNANTPYHALLVVHSWQQNKVSDHNFIPSSTLFPSEAKDITWGDLRSNKNGNGMRFYTSFPPLSFVIPYLWFCGTGLPATAANLQILTISFSLLSCVVLAMLLGKIYPGLPLWFRTLLSVSLGVFSIETLHVSSSIYWAQIPFQLLFLLQLYFFERFWRTMRRLDIGIFLLLSFCACLIEWTAYVGNLGFLLVFLFFAWKQKNRRKFCIAVLLSIVTLSALGVILWHFLLGLEWNVLFEKLFSRYEARGLRYMGTATSYYLGAFILLLRGYVFSFRYHLVAFVLFLLPFFFYYLRLRKSKGTPVQDSSASPGLFLFLAASVLVENIILLLHAIDYTFDRIKAVVFLSIFFCGMICFFKNESTRKRLMKISTVFLIFAAVFSYQFVVFNKSSYIRYPFPAGNRAIIEYVNQNFSRDNSILAFANFYNGYCNISFNRDLHAYVYDKTLSNDNEWRTTKHGKPLPEILQVTKDNGKRFLVLVKLKYEHDTAKPTLQSVIVYDMLNGTNETLSAETLLALKDKEKGRIPAPPTPCA